VKLVGYITAEQAADYLGLPSVAALHTLLYRRRVAGRPITTHRLSGRLRFRTHELDAALTTERARRSGLRVVAEKASA
jgi:hypothetical protein